MLIRDPSGNVNGDAWDGTGDHAHLDIGGGTPFASAANPTAEVIKGTGVAAGTPLRGPTLSVTNGTIAIRRAGSYLVELDLRDISPAAANGVMTAEVQVNAAAATMRLRARTVTTVETGGVDNAVCMHASRVLTLTKGDLVRAVLTGTTGGVLTVADGSLSVTQIADASPATPADHT